jgi:hypothetical protein
LTTYQIEALPKSIWFREFGSTDPSCYAGSPEEILLSMAKDFGPKISLEDAITIIRQNLRETRGLHINLPSGAPRRIRAAFIIAALLASGCARETPQA